MFSNCRDDCWRCYLHYIDCCLAGNGDDDFMDITKDLFNKLINRIDMPDYAKKRLIENFPQFKEK